MAAIASLNLSIEYKENVTTPLKHRQLMNRVNREEMGRHALEFLPKHFEFCPENRVGGGYKIAARSLRWTKYKKKKGYPNIPNVATGALRDYVLSHGHVTATADRARLVCRQIYKLRPAQRQQRNSEIEAITPDEMANHRGSMKRLYSRLVQTKDYRRQRTMRTRG